MKEKGEWKKVGRYYTNKKEKVDIWRDKQNKLYNLEIYDLKNRGKFSGGSFSVSIDYKKFKTKSQALKYAEDYMIKHLDKQECEE